MGKKSKKADKIKLSKQIAGVKIPKPARKSINKLLKQLPAPAAKPLLGAAVGALVTTLAERLEEPLRELVESHTARSPRNGKESRPTAH
jgi:hypothetical protein